MGEKVCCSVLVAHYEYEVARTFCSVTFVLSSVLVAHYELLLQEHYNIPFVLSLLFCRVFLSRATNYCCVLSGENTLQCTSWRVRTEREVCCSLLQSVAVCCCLLQSVACTPRARCVAVCCSLLQSVAVCCSLLRVHQERGVLQSVAVCCSLLQFIAVCCSLLQFVACTPRARCVAV